MTAPVRMATGDWIADALCAQTDLDLFHPEKGKSNAEAKRVCGHCPVQRDCLRWAVETDERSGVLGGMSWIERRRLTVADVDAMPPVVLAAERIPPGQPLPLSVVPKVRPRPIPEPRPVPEEPPAPPLVVAKRRKVALCGTTAGYTRHKRLKESPCDPCRAANAEYQRAWWAKKKQAADNAGLYVPPKSVAPEDPLQRSGEKPRVRVMWLLPPTSAGSSTEYAIDNGHGALVPIHPNAAADLVEQGETIHARYVTDWVQIT